MIGTDIAISRASQARMCTQGRQTPQIYGLIDEAQAEVMRASQPGAQDTDDRVERAD